MNQDDYNALYVSWVLKFGAVSWRLSDFMIYFDNYRPGRAQNIDSWKRQGITLHFNVIFKMKKIISLLSIFPSYWPFSHCEYFLSFIILSNRASNFYMLVAYSLVANVFKLLWNISEADVIISCCIPSTRLILITQFDRQSSNKFQSVDRSY